jgi:hypothetical protein
MSVDLVILNSKMKSLKRVVNIISNMVSSNLEDMFGRDTSLIDRDIVKVILSDPAKKKILMDQIKKDKDFSIILHGKNLEFDEIENELVHQ